MMPDDMAIKVLKMRAGFCSWGHVMERFGSHYSTVGGLRNALKRWGIRRSVEIGWAFPHRNSKGKHPNVTPPPQWKETLQLMQGS
jgi:hypothetical protein